MRPTVVFLIGGLGNQLHQLSVALGLAEYGPVAVSMDLMGTQRSVETSAVISAAGLQVVRADGQRALRHQLAAIDPQDPPPAIITFPDFAPWMAHHSNPTLFFSCMRALFDPDTLPMRESDVSGIIHMRLGDYLWPRAARVYGVLNSQYYRRAISALGSRRLALVTDDAAGARRLHRRLLVELEIGVTPDGTTIGDFYRMCHAESFVAANSTLSLWAAWYRAQGGLGPTASPAELYRIRPRTDIPGLGRVAPSYVDPVALVVQHPWVLNRRIAWRGKFW